MNYHDASQPIAGTLTEIAASPYASGRDAAPGVSPAFRATPYMAVWLTLDTTLAAGSAPGAIAATVQLIKSVDEGRTWRPMTLFGVDGYIFTTRMCEPVAADDCDGAWYRIVAMALAAPVAYRIGHA